MSHERKKKEQGGRSPILGAAVLKALLSQHGEAGQDGERELYKGVLRDLDLTDEQVEEYLAEHGEEVEEAIRTHGRRGS